MENAPLATPSANTVADSGQPGPCRPAVASANSASAEATQPPIVQPRNEANRVRVLPAHVDPTVAYHERMHLVRGDEVLGTWPVDLRGW